MWNTDKHRQQLSQIALEDKTREFAKYMDREGLIAERNQESGGGIE